MDQETVLGSVGVPAEAETAVGLASTYARMAGELAAMVEAESERAARSHAVLVASLAQLRTALEGLVAGVARGEW